MATLNVRTLSNSDLKPEMLLLEMAHLQTDTYPGSI